MLGCPRRDTICLCQFPAGLGKSTRLLWVHFDKRNSFVAKLLLQLPVICTRRFEYDQFFWSSPNPLCQLCKPDFIIGKPRVSSVSQSKNIKRIFGNVDTDCIVQVSFPPCLVIRVVSPSLGKMIHWIIFGTSKLRSGHKKRRGRPYSSTVHHDQEGNDPSLAVAQHKCRAERRLLYRTGATFWIRQEGGAKEGGDPLTGRSMRSNHREGSLQAKAGEIFVHRSLERRMAS